VREKQTSMMMWGCQDEIGTSACLALPALYSPQGDISCQWPTAELCLSTCGQCHLVEAARKCSSFPSECSGASSSTNMGPPNFCSSGGAAAADDDDDDGGGAGEDHVNWAEWFTAITSASNGRFRILNRETPWVAEYSNFLNDAEVDELIRISVQEVYRDEDEYPNHIRDVSVTNCDSIRCMTEPFINELYGRVSDMVGFAPNSFESMEFIHYGPGQHYRWHADEYSWKYPPKKVDPVTVLSGPRVLTMFFYLSDVTEGGETAFAGPDATGMTRRLAVTPRKGKMILWANMKDDWRVSEPAAVHSAIPVRKGQKIAATLWIHSSGFRIPELYAGRQCHARYN